MSIPKLYPYNYDVLLSCHKKRAEEIVKDILEGKTKAIIITKSFLKENFYRNLFIHELSHLITLNNHSFYNKLSDRFDEVNKKISLEPKIKSLRLRIQRVI